jgi:WD40 repeat protein
VEFSPDGRLIATTGGVIYSDNTVRLWGILSLTARPWIAYAISGAPPVSFLAVKEVCH